MSDTKSFKQISVGELRQWMSQGKDFILIDTLTNDHFENVHLPGAVNACVFEVVFPAKVEAITVAKDRPIVVYGFSHKTHDAATAAEKLQRLGYSDIAALVGGIEAWRDAGFPLEGGNPSEKEDTKGLKLEDHAYSVDTEQSVIEWTGRNPNTKHYGTLRISKGEILVRDGAITGDFEIDMRSIKNLSLEGNELQPVLIAHLLSDDFFFAERHPKIHFTIDSARQVKDPTLTAPNFEIEGTLTMRGTAGKISFPATVSNLNDGVISAEAHFDIDRTNWNIIYGSSRFFEHLGMHVVFDLISLQVRVVAQ